MAFQSPVGTQQERESGQIWPGTWTDATPYLTSYIYGYHTGADLNNNRPRFDSDAHAEVYAIGDGMVTYARLVSKKVWGNLIVIDHGTVDSKPLFSRYGHVEAMNVAVGQSVKMGDFIARVGNGEGLFPYHLHFDISATSQLGSAPTYWPGRDRQGVKHHFVDPLAWLRGHMNATAETRPGGKPDSGNVSGGESGTRQPTRPENRAPLPVWYVIAPQGAQLYKNPSAAAEKSGVLPRGSRLNISGDGVKNESLMWAKVVGGDFNGDWIAIGKADRSETYVSTNPPQ